MDKMERKILLNPGPVTTTDTVKNALIVPDICHRENEFGELLFYLGNSLRDIIHADESYTTIFLGSSGTGAVEATISSAIPFGQKLLVIQNGHYGERISSIASTYHIQTVNVSHAFNEQPPLAVLEETLRADDDISAVAMVHHETSSGILNSLDLVSDLVKKFNKIFIVDAISSFGGIPIDLRSNPIDYLIATSNKCLQALPGVAFVIAREKVIINSKENARSFYFDLYKQYLSLKTERMFRFTPPVQILYALSQAIKEYNQEGGEERYLRYQTNYDILMNGLDYLAFENLVPKAYQGKLLALVRPRSNEQNLNFEGLHDFLYEAGFTIYPTKISITNAFRLACIGDIHAKDIHAFLACLEMALPVFLQDVI